MSSHRNEKRLPKSNARPSGAMWVGVALGACILISVACSSDAGLSEDDMSSSSGGVDGGLGNPDGAGGDANPNAFDDPNDNPDGGPPYHPEEGFDAAASLVCGSNSVVFDLTQLGPDPSMPSEFTTAWDFEVGNPVATAKPPALVLAAKGLYTGPIDIRIGGTLVEAGNTVVPAAGTGTTATLTVPIAPVKTNLKLDRTVVNFALTLGSVAARRSIPVGAVSFNFEVDQACDSLNGTLRLEIPGSGGSMQFGEQTTLADVLGDPNADLDGDFVNEGWALDFLASRGSVTPVSLAP